MHTDAFHHRYAPPLWRHDRHLLIGLRREIEATLARHGLPAAGDVVADFGCGDQPYRPLFASRCAKYLGCDLDGGADVRFEPGRPLPLGDGSVDGVVSFQVLEHVWDLDWYLGECRRILKPGGWLLLSTHGTWLYHPHPTDFRRWTRDGLAGELTARGFVVAGVTSVVGPLAWTTLIRLVGYREALRRVPILGPVLLAPLAVAMNLRMIVEDAITPASIRDTNAAVYVTVSRVSSGDKR
jgi:SAM-dependent methyltransferase